MDEAQGVRFGHSMTEEDYKAFCQRSIRPISWALVEEDGYTPGQILQMIKDYRELREQRKNIVETNTRYMNENRELRRRLNAKG
ncbi:hypothetical protein DRO27_05325 [Candidatus Bathyarchaeota archaeon]|nr:MAG: hypothetical protein DRO27_05325 [Candidatus Bathyarchaeota archaeon]